MKKINRIHKILDDCIKLRESKRIFPIALFGIIFASTVVFLINIDKIKNPSLWIILFFIILIILAYYIGNLSNEIEKLYLKKLNIK